MTTATPTTTSTTRTSFRGDELIINYHDAVIYGSDLKLLETKSAWLNDACIHFYFTWLQQQQQAQPNHHERKSTEHDNSNNPPPAATTPLAASKVLFLDPAVLSFVMHQCHDQEDVDDLLAGYKSFFIHMSTKQFIFLPINDVFLNASSSLSDHRHPWTRPGSGTHWSLLLVCIHADAGSSSSSTTITFHHFDSIRGHNFDAARVVATRFQHILDYAAHVVQIDPNNSNNKNNTQTTVTSYGWSSNHQDHHQGISSYESKEEEEDHSIIVVQECKTPQQTNGYDCGVHMLAAAQVLSQQLQQNDITVCYEQVLQDGVTALLVSQLRFQIANTIRTLHNSGQ